jgi:hypothetical protein
MGIPATLSSVPNLTPYIQYIAASNQTLFPYPFPITQDSDLVVVINGVTQPTDSGYSLSGQGNPTGGNLTFTSGQAGGNIITLYRDIPIERVTQIAQNSGFSSIAFNAEYNNLYLICQQLQESIDLCLQVPNTNVDLSGQTLLTPANYANKYLAFDANGNPEPAVLTSSGTLTPSIVTELIYAQTTQELAAGYTPTSTAIPVEFDIERFGGQPGTSALNIAANNTALASAISLATNSGFGVTVHFRAGKSYGFSSSFSLPEYFSMCGEAGTNTEFVYSGTGTFLTFPSSVTTTNSGRNTLQNILIYSAGQVGIGLQLGDSSGPASRVILRNVVTNSFNYGVELIGTLWSVFYDCEFGSAAGGSSASPVLTNNYGIYININGNSFSSTTYLYNCTVSNNNTSGIYNASGATGVDYDNFALVNCNVQNNCVGSTATPQIQWGNSFCGPVALTVQNLYGEYTLGGTAPPFMNIANVTNASITDGYFSTCKYGIYDSIGSSVSQVTIRNNIILGAVTDAISLTGSETDVHVYNNNVEGGTVVCPTTGGCSYIPSSGGIASHPNALAAYGTTPSLTDGTHTPTQTVTSSYSKVGNIVNFKIKIVTSALNSLGAGVEITNAMPIASATGADETYTVNVVGWTPASSETLMYGLVLNGGTTMSLYGGGIAAPAAINGSALAAATTIYVQGSYQTAS